MGTIHNRDSSYHQLVDLGARQIQVLNVIKVLKNPTNRMISEFMRLPINCITGRVKELRDKGYVVEDGNVFDTLTKRKVTRFRATAPATGNLFE